MRDASAIDLDTITVDGRPVREVAAEHGVSRGVLYQRLYERWAPERAATTPPRRGLTIDGRRAIQVAAEHGVSATMLYHRVRRGADPERAASASPYGPWAMFTPEERSVLARSRVSPSLAKWRIEVEGMDRTLALSTPPTAGALPPERYVATPEERASMRAAGVSRSLWSVRMRGGWDRVRASTEPPRARGGRPRKVR